MTNKGRKMEPPLKLDMSFDEAMSRFVAAAPEEVSANIERSKTKRPPEDGLPGRPERKKRGMALPNRNRKLGKT